MLRALLIVVTSFLLLFFISCKEEPKKEAPMTDPKGPKETAELYQEAYRPQYHFSPKEKWMNDPNGLVYHQGVYHLFYQYYPEDIVWGPMHWGHAASADMIHWEHKPIALFPDEHGYIFSGSAVVDKNNTSGLGTHENPPLVAIFTYHDPEGEAAKKTDFQTQGIAYSLDNGESWTKFKGNPVIGNDGIKDFRDPKVFWNQKAQQWTMLLVAGDHLQIWNSDNLTAWVKVSEFGKDQGAHGGVWECPDLFPLKIDDTGVEKWVLLISTNPGGPNGGSGTQYFIGDFDGKSFTSDQKATRWLDHGTDNYAGVTYNNTPNGDRLFIGWMSNWNYARDTPTLRWRSAMTVPRKLSLHKIEGNLHLRNYPVKALDEIIEKTDAKDLKIAVGASDTIVAPSYNQTEIQFSTAEKDFGLSFKNEVNEEFVITVSKSRKIVLVDRVASGKTNFQESFGSSIHQMPIDDLPNTMVNVRILMDQSSMELFINDGQYVMTEQLFPTIPYTTLVVDNVGEVPLTLKNFVVSPVRKIW